MMFKLIPVESKQTLQIGILEKLALCLVTILIPAGDLTGLIVAVSACHSERISLDDRLTPSQYQKRVHLPHFFNEPSRRLQP